MKKFQQYQNVKGISSEGEEVLGVYINPRADKKTHLIWDGEEYYIIKDKDIREATEEEEDIIDKKMDEVYEKLYYENFGIHPSHTNNDAEDAKKHELSDFEILASANK
jgi:hypothetical protein